MSKLNIIPLEERIVLDSALAAAVVSQTAFSHAHQVYVDLNAHGANNGTSWSNAYTTLQEALAADTGNSPETILMAAGTYNPGSSATSTYTLPNNLEIIGGQHGSGPTILSGINSKNTSILTATNDTDILDNLTISEANTSSAGGGLSMTNSNILLLDDLFTNDNSTIMYVSKDTGYGGGAVYALNSILGVQNSVFTNDTAVGTGGAISDTVTTLGSAYLGILNSQFTNDISGNIVETGSVPTSLNYSGGAISYLDTLTSSGSQTQGMDVINSVFSKDTSANGNGGAINDFVYGTTTNFISTINVQNSQFNNDTAASPSFLGGAIGGAIAYYDNITSGQNRLTLNVSNSVFNNDIATGSGGAIDIATTFFSQIPSVLTLDVQNSQFSNDANNTPITGYGDNGGGAIDLEASDTSSSLTVLNSQFTNNTETNGGAGGAILAEIVPFNFPSATGGMITIGNSQFTNNSVTGLDAFPGTTNGGALFLFGNTTIINSSFQDNTIGLSGGGGAVLQAYGSLYVNDSTFINNLVEGDLQTNSFGGAISTEFNSSVNISNSLFEGNQSQEGYGGAVDLEQEIGNISVKNNTFINNTSAYGGALDTQFENGSVNISSNNFINNSASIQGGAYFDSSEANTVTLTNNNFSGNSAQGSQSNGGAVFIEDDASVNISNNIFLANSAGGGGAIDITQSGEIAINGNLFSLNSATYGGAVDVDNSEDGSVTDNLFLGNYAISSYGGGAIDAYLNGNITITKNSFALNSDKTGYSIVLSNNSTVNETIIGSSPAVPKDIAAVNFLISLSQIYNGDLTVENLLSDDISS